MFTKAIWKIAATKMFPAKQVKITNNSIEILKNVFRIFDSATMVCATPNSIIFGLTRRILGAGSLGN